MTLEPSLFDLGDDLTPPDGAPEMNSVQQRSSVRDVFAALGVSDASAQFEIVHQLTGQRVRSPRELLARYAQVLVARLADRLRTQKVRRTGNAWDDREEDTWIDKL